MSIYPQNPVLTLQGEDFFGKTIFLCFRNTMITLENLKGVVRRNQTFD